MTTAALVEVAATSLMGFCKMGTGGNSSGFAVFAVLATVLAPALAPLNSLACGYHDDVSLARGMLNWTYPDALHVMGAISAAIVGGRLPSPGSETATPDLLGFKYRAAVKSLERLGESLHTASEQQRLSLSLVLLEPMLWTRFEADRGEMRAQVHVSGPQRGDLVLVSGETVMREVTNGRMTIGDAHKLGLIRLYGLESQVTQFLDAYRDVGNRGGEHD